MGLEEHLLAMFRHDAEFNDQKPSHLGHSTAPAAAPAPVPTAQPIILPQAATWSAEAEQELKKIPFFVRGKARRNTERFALDKGASLITVETLYDAKAHFGR
jgi:light-independent protochlorophyllide reductase subunit B